MAGLEVIRRMMQRKVDANLPDLCRYDHQSCFSKQELLYFHPILTALTITPEKNIMLVMAVTYGIDVQMATLVTGINIHRITYIFFYG